MTARHDLDRMLDAFLMDGPVELPDPSFDTVRDRMETTRQRVVIGPWRVPDMSKLVPIGLGVAALVVAIVVGARLLGPAPAGPGTLPFGPANRHTNAVGRRAIPIGVQCHSAPDRDVHHRTQWHLDRVPDRLGDAARH